MLWRRVVQGCSLRLYPLGENDNTTVRCRVIDTNSDPIIVASSKEIFLNIQGLLDPPSNLALSEAGDGLKRVLRWEAPASLDITDVDPDIQSYWVCYNLTSNDLSCISVSSSERREFKFLNVHVPLLFAVTAVK